MIPYGRQWVNQQDIDAVVETLQSDFLAQGPKVPAFEQALAKQVDVPYCTVTNSATSALHVACLALNVGPGDIVWTSPISFVASANCARYCDAEVEFVDIDPANGNMSVEALAQKIQIAKESGRLPKVIIPVHFAGQSCDMKAIADIVAPFNIKIIEDASHALGGVYRGKPVGCGEFSDISVFSFHPVKMITSAEGGCLCVKEETLDSRIKMLMNHGITKEASAFLEVHEEPWYYEQQILGFNFRMTELQAALGLSQLSRLTEWVEKRNTLIDRYKELTQDLPIEWLHCPEHTLCSYHLAVIKVESRHRLPLFNFLRANDVGVQVHYIPIYRQPYYRNIEHDCPQAEHFYQTIISLPLFPRLRDKEQEQVSELLTRYFQ